MGCQLSKPVAGERVVEPDTPKRYGNASPALEVGAPASPLLRQGLAEPEATEQREWFEAGRVEMAGEEAVYWRFDELGDSEEALRRGARAWSPPFTLPCVAAPFPAWRLFVAPHETPGSVSLYLAACGGSLSQLRGLPAVEGGADQELLTTFSLALTGVDAGLLDTRTSCEELDVAPAPAPVTLSHRFSAACPEWGVQELLPLAEFLKLASSDSGAVELVLHDINNRPTRQPVPKLSVRLEPGEPTVRVLSTEPTMVAIDGFLSGQECSALMALADEDLRRSRVTDGKVSEGRTSQGMFLTGQKGQESIVHALERKIYEALRNVSVAPLVAAPLVSAEPVQVVKYEEGQYYTTHYDNRNGSTMRAATFMIYLCDVVDGGCTFFPKAKPTGGGDHVGIRIQPKCGRAVLFWSVRDGKEDELSLHAAEPVLSGQKWICTKWLTESG